METVVMAVGMLAALAAHELGHAAAAQALGLTWHPFARFPWKVGIAVVVPVGGLRAEHDLAVALAGPAVSLALVALWPVAPELAILSGVVGVLNLLPFVPGSDGQRALRAARAWRRV